MLSTVFAAESQFHLDVAERERAQSVLASIRSRREALSASAHAAVRPAAPRRAAWPRPIATAHRLDAAQPVGCAA